MKYRNSKTRVSGAMTLVEMVLALAIVAIVFGAVVPQFRAVLNSWDFKKTSSEVLQNGRVLIDHLNRNLSRAVRIAAVSESAENNGFVEFEGNDANSFRYDIGENNYVEYGLAGAGKELAGPVSQLQFTCYDACDLDTPLDISTADVNDIRFLKVQVTLTNPYALGQDKTFIAQAYIRTNAASGSDGGLVGWWKLDDGSGLTAADSSGLGNNGSLGGMAGDEWTAGPVAGALEFNGSNQFVAVGNSSVLQLTSSLSIAGWVKADSWGSGYDVDIIARKGDANPNNYQLAITDGQATLYLDENDGYGFRGDTVLKTEQWYHVAGTWDGETVCVYVDGVIDNSPDSFSNTLGTDTRNLYIGGRDGTDVLDGVVDDVRIYNQALGAEDIAGLAGPWELTGGTSFEYDNVKGVEPAVARVDESHYLCAYNGNGMDGWAVILVADTATDTITKETPFEYDPVQGITPALCQIDSTHYLCAYRGPDGDGWAAILTVNTGNWTISKESDFEFETTKAETPALAKIDNRHYLCVYNGVDGDGWAVVLAINTGNWTISGGTPFEFDTQSCIYPALAQIDSTHYLCTYRGFNEKGWASILTVNTGPGTISTGSTFEIAPKAFSVCALHKIDYEHYLYAYRSYNDDGFAVVLTVDTGSWAVSTGSVIEYDTVTGRFPSLAEIDKSRYLCAYQCVDSDGQAIILDVNRDNWTITAGDTFEYETTFVRDPALSKIDDGHYLCVYEGPNYDGWSTILNVGVNPTEPEIVVPVGP